MSNIQPYPQEDYYQQKQHYSVYRPAYHRIPSTPAIHKDDWTSPNSSPIVVPSMIPSHYYHHHPSNYNYIPSYHALGNATISYDTTIEPGFQKELVKDVFFSPAMPTTPVRELSPCPSSSASSTCEEPSELLFQDSRHDTLFDFGLDLATPSHTTSTYEEVKMASSFNHSIAKNNNKRRCSDSVLQERKKQRFNFFTTASPPESPYSYTEEEDSGVFFESELEPLDHPIFWDESEEEQQEVKVTLPKKVKKQRMKKEKKVADEHDKMSIYDHVPQVPPRPTSYPTIYQKLTKANVDWCRYCGTTEGVNWRPGPWGKRTLCNKHGCDYKGYGFACKLPRLDLTGFVKESIDERERPVLQLFCSGCQRKESWEGNVLVRCEGCPKAYHQKCCPEGEISDERVASTEAWYCDASCCENSRRKRIIVELPRKRLPLMCAPKNVVSSSSS